MGEAGIGRPPKLLPDLSPDFTGRRTARPPPAAKSDLRHVEVSCHILLRRLHSPRQPETRWHPASGASSTSGHRPLLLSAHGLVVARRAYRVVMSVRKQRRGYSFPANRLIVETTSSA